MPKNKIPLRSIYAKKKHFKLSAFSSEQSFKVSLEWPLRSPDIFYLKFAIKLD